jgi:hypothetical protein
MAEVYICPTQKIIHMRTTIIALILFVGISATANAQSLAIESYDAVVEMNSTNVKDYSGHVKVKNVTNIALDVYCKRMIFGTTNCAFDSAYFCWDLCYPNTVDQSFGPVTIGAGESTTNFTGHAYSPNTGVNCIDSIRYTFYNSQNNADSVSVVMKYSANSVFSVDEAALPVSDIFPNPASQFVTVQLVSTPKPGTTIEVFNLLGAKVRSIAAKGKRVEIPVSDLYNGIYLITLNVDGKAVETRKIVVRH